MIYVIPEWPSGFPYFLQFKPEFCIKKFIFWTIVSSRSCFCWLSYRASACLATNFIINLILVLTIWWCWKRVFAMTSMFSWQNSVKFCHAAFCTPSPNLPVIPGISRLPAVAFQPPMMKRASFFGLSSRRCYRASKNWSTSTSLASMIKA